MPNSNPAVSVAPRTQTSMTGLTPIQTIEIEIREPIRSTEVMTENSAITVLLYTAPERAATYQHLTTATVKRAEVLINPDDPRHATVHIF